MNLLQSLAMRTLDTPPAIEPPRVPYVSLFPLEPILTPDADGAFTSPAAPAAPMPRPPFRSAATTREPPPPRERAAAQVPAGSPELRVPEQPADETIAQHPVPASVQTIVEQHVPIVGEIPPSPSTIPPRPMPQPEPGPAAAVTHEISHTQHHHWVEHRVESLVREVEPAPLPVATPAAIEPRPVARGTPPVPRLADVPARPTVAAPGVPAEAPAAPPPPSPAPVVNVTIGRVTVKLQPPAPAARSETTRPAAPSLGLDAYTAARRGRT